MEALNTEWSQVASKMYSSSQNGTDVPPGDTKENKTKKSKSKKGDDGEIEDADFEVVD